MNQEPMIIYSVLDFSMGPYNYFVITPENDTLYFVEKSEARAFINFYHEYTKTHPQKMIRSNNGSNT